ncbi:hypothetical protein CMI47_20225 [Candidatus Pacearchaeota archaeon]|nr:hypothetical protein [Candidatus Pacearchaeota archaeon]|tara:strand:- start:3130 stop:3723 length:594 start_codon:yes stop_codon:yes gene_type:complete
MATEFDENLYKRALAIAEDVHRHQTRDGGEPYIEHPKRVAKFSFLKYARHLDSAYLAAAVLHDTLEDSDNPNKVYQRIYRECGPTVAAYVDLLSKPAEKHYRNKRYLATLSVAPPGVLMIKLADRIDNLQGLSVGGWKEERVRHYLEDSETLYRLAVDRGFRREAAFLKAPILVEELELRSLSVPGNHKEEENCVQK